MPALGVSAMEGEEGELFSIVETILSKVTHMKRNGTTRKSETR